MALATAKFELGINGNDIPTSDAGSAIPWDLKDSGGTITYDNVNKYGTLLDNIVVGASAYQGPVAGYASKIRLVE
jgi:hypothetical protein